MPYSGLFTILWSCFSYIFILFICCGNKL